MVISVERHSMDVDSEDRFQWNTGEGYHHFVFIYKLLCSFITSMLHSITKLVLKHEITILKVGLSRDQMMLSNMVQISIL